MRIAGIIHESLNDGVGVRMVLFISGCKHRCPGCHNLEACDFQYGRLFDKDIADYIIDYVKKDPLLEGITLSGGDPMFSAQELIPFLQRFRKEVKNKTVWMYTGFRYEDIEENEILEYVDVVVDGLYEQEKRDRSLLFRGSSNQRIIDVLQSKAQERPILWKQPVHDSIHASVYGSLKGAIHSVDGKLCGSNKNGIACGSMNHPAKSSLKDAKKASERKIPKMEELEEGRMVILHGL